jgi:RND family efflux transporter MFP subunit
MSETKSSGRVPILLYLFGLLAVVGTVVLVFSLWSNKKSTLRADTKERATEADSGPRVGFITVAPGRMEHTVSLIGEARPFNTATLYAKVSGYLKEIRVDKGDRVTANQVLGIIESPETDHQYQAAVADAKNKRLNAERAKTLVKQDMIAQQEADQAEADAQVSEANVASLNTLKSYEIIHAPFDGIVTSRYADPGALVQNATTSQTSALPLLTIAEVDRLRVYVYPDQSDAYATRIGDPAQITLQERPGVHLGARVTRASGELDARTRTLLTEIDFDNKGGMILPGSFVQVSLRVRAAKDRAIIVPSGAIILRGDKAFVAVIQENNAVHFMPVVLGDDQGPFVQVASGLQPGQRVALNLGDSVPEGARVQPIENKTP